MQVVRKNVAEDQTQLDSFERKQHHERGRFDPLGINLFIFSKFCAQRREHTPVIAERKTQLLERRRAQKQFAIQGSALHVFIQQLIDNRCNRFIQGHRFRIKCFDSLENGRDRPLVLTFEQDMQDRIFAKKVLI